MGAELTSVYHTHPPMGKAWGKRCRERRSTPDWRRMQGAFDMIGRCSNAEAFRQLGSDVGPLLRPPEANRRNSRGFMASEHVPKSTSMGFRLLTLLVSQSPNHLATQRCGPREYCPQVLRACFRGRWDGRNWSLGGGASNNTYIIRTQTLILNGACCM